MNTTRRNFLKSTALMSGGLVIGCYIPQTMRLVHAEDDKAPLMNAWLRIGSDNRITLLMAHSEMGQGVYTALPMLIAEELEVAVANIKLEPVPIVETYNNPLVGSILTGGSTTVRSRWQGLRQAAAQARHMLIATAAEQWQVKAETCEAKNGQIRHPSTNRAFNYGELAEQAAQKIPPDEVQLKSADEFKVLGQPIPRIDTPAKVNGSAQFGLDVRLPNMLYAAVQQAPVFGSQAKSYDEAAAKAVPGVKAVVKLPNGVAVVASSYWQAQKGVKALNTQFTDTDNSQIDSKTISQELKAGLSAQQAAQAQSKGEDIQKALKAVQDTLEAEYSVPFLAHATMEPMNCTAMVEENRCEIWVPTQAQSLVQKKAVAITGLGPEKIKINTTYLGGGFGRRAETDFVEQALLLSQAVKQPVQVVWSREEDMQHDVYRPAAMVKMTAGLDEQGKPTALKSRIVSPSIFAR
ncbi:MAG: molybdopterin cofactor-binding domain-containing protein, partial [Pseudomonadota bacterium]|nr:molybdopterin cofactor-binding domain-containing protein [Pseudomonadota bacterium]